MSVSEYIFNTPLCIHVLGPGVNCRLSEACLDETVAHLVAALLLNTRSITDDTVARMDADAQEVSRCFAKFQKPERVRMIPSAPLRPLPRRPPPPPSDLSRGGGGGGIRTRH